MKFHVIECSPSILRFDLERYPDRDESFIYEHLKYYCSKFVASSMLPSALPSAQVKIHGDSLVVTSRHKYAQIAKELNVPVVRVVLIENAPGDISKIASISNIRILDYKLIQQEELQSLVQDAWHVFFFRSALTPQEQDAFEENIAGIFLRLERSRLLERDPYVAQLAFPFEGTCGEFVARTPAADQSWVASFWKLCHQFSNHVVRLVSYQGRRFEST